MTVFRRDEWEPDPRAKHEWRRDIVGELLAWVIVVAVGVALTIVVIRVGW